MGRATAPRRREQRERRSEKKIALCRRTVEKFSVHLSTSSRRTEEGFESVRVPVMRSMSKHANDFFSSLVEVRPWSFADL